MASNPVHFFTLVRMIHARFNCVYLSDGETLEEHLESQEPKGQESVHIYWGQEQNFHLYNADSSDPDIDDHHAQFCNWALNRLFDLGYPWNLATISNGSGITGYTLRIVRFGASDFIITGKTKYEAIAHGLLKALEVKASG